MDRKGMTLTRAGLGMQLARVQNTHRWTRPRMPLLTVFSLGFGEITALKAHITLCLKAVNS